MSTGYYLPPIVTATSIRAVYPQIIGYVVTVLPPTPNSNPEFVWQ